MSADFGKALVRARVCFAHGGLGELAGGEARQRLGNHSAATTRKTLPVRLAFQEPWPPAVPLPTRGEAKKQEGGGNEDLLGYRAPPSTWGGQRGASLLSGLGAKLREARVLEKDGGGVVCKHGGKKQSLG